MNPDLGLAIHDAISAAQNLGLAIGGGVAAPDLDESLAASDVANRRLWSVYHGTDRAVA